MVQVVFLIDWHCSYLYGGEILIWNITGWLPVAIYMAIDVNLNSKFDHFSKKGAWDLIIITERIYGVLFFILKNIE
jgi:hypothetical protein